MTALLSRRNVFEFVELVGLHFDLVAGVDWDPYLNRLITVAECQFKTEWSRGVMSHFNDYTTQI